MNDTPRTDAAPKAAYRDAMFCELVSADFARQLERELADVKINSEFWLDHAKRTNTEFQTDYLAIGREVKQPDLTVLESVRAMKAELALNAKMLARQCDLAREAEAKLAALGALIAESISGELTHAGTMNVGDDNQITGVFVRMIVEELRAVKRLPMYRRVAVVEAPEVKSQPQK